VELRGASGGRRGWGAGASQKRVVLATSDVCGRGVGLEGVV